MTNDKPLRRLTGKRFGRLVVLEDYYKFEEYDKSKHAWCKCKCDCGNICDVKANRLIQGDTKSCGCYHMEAITKHNMSRSRFYNIYNHIYQRCNNTNNDRYKNYGGRGIKCLWKSFEEFKNDMYDSYVEHVDKYGEFDTSIDRIDVNGNYCKENCKWSTNKEQQANKQGSIFVYDDDGTRYCMSHYCNKYGINVSTVRYYIRKYRLSPQQAVLKVRGNNH